LSAPAVVNDQIFNAVACLAPPRLNTLLTSGWVNSAMHGRPMNARGDAIPWFTYPAIDFLEPRIRPSWNVLEWGCGQSTLWWAARVNHVFSIEHDPAWHTTIATDAPINATIELIENASAYVDASAGPFDAIVIDGEDRNACARVAAQRIKPDGIIIFDNSDRKMYREGLAFLTDSGWKRLDFFGVLPTYLYRTCTSIFYRGESFLRVDTLPCDHASSLGPTCAQVLGE
jgi:hypothetical protein